MKFTENSRDRVTMFGKNLRYIRKKRGYSLNDLSKKTGISIRMLSYYEIEASNPPIEKLEIIAKTLDVSINDLLGKSKENKSKKVKIDDEIINIDTRTLQKIRDLLSLPPQDRAIVYSMINGLVESRKLKKQTQLQEVSK